MSSGPRRISKSIGICVLVGLLLSAGRGAHAAEHAGQVSFNGLPVPGATVIAVQGERTVTTSTDSDGRYQFADLPDGVWSIRVEMPGFAPAGGAVAVAAGAAPARWMLTLLAFEQIAAARLAPSDVPPSEAEPVASPVAPASRATGPLEGRAPAAEPAEGSAPAVTVPMPAPSSMSAADEGNPFATDSQVAALGAADGLLVNGSVNNAAASPFAQPRAFGNSRPGQRSLYTGMVGALVGHSAWDARPFSFTAQQTPKPSYSDVQFLSTFGGPVRIPRLWRNAGNLFVGYQRSGETTASTQSAIVPTARERAGDFSQTRDGFGRPLEIIDPLTGAPFPDGVIPAGRISPEPASLLRWYPAPSLDGVGFNYQAAAVSATRQDSVQSRWNQPFTARSQVTAAVAYQRTRIRAQSMFGFEDAIGASGLDAQANWFHRLSQFVSTRLRYQFTGLTNTTTPHFAGRTNVAGEAGILGGNQDPENWGPPSLTFSSGIAGLSTAQHADTRNRIHAAGGEAILFRGRHTVTVGGDLKRQAIEIDAQQDPRGSFAFTGAATGSDLADFLLGLPATSALAAGNPDKSFRGWIADAYITDDWRVGPWLTLNLGVRWEYESPLAERLGRLVNLDVASNFASVSPVLGTDPVGPLTGADFGSALMRPDWTGLQPRLAAAWRPIAGSSFVVRAGYGIYRNTGVYQSIATQLAQQPPFSTSFSVETSPAAPLRLRDGLLAGRGGTLPTFAVDPDFRVGSVHNWQVSAQRDLPGSLTIAGTYLGSKGSRLLQMFLPNSVPAGAGRACVACPSGFVYLASDGTSLRHAGQVQLRRRLRNGLQATVQYTLAKAIDNASAFTGGVVGGATIAQDWLDLDAETGPSSFDQRHLVSAQVQYTTGAGVTGGTLVDGWKGRLFKDWTFSSQLTVGSGLPLTPIYLTQVGGTGVVGTVRASATGADPHARPEGYYLNPLAYAAPAAGEWGNVGRNSATGPRQFSLNAAVARTFRMGDRLNLDWRIDATNVLNRVTYSGVNTIVGSPQFGLPNRANPMRKVQSSLRLRF